jgi:hypothetical protein
MKHRRDHFIRASEVGEYVFCARAWRLRLDGHIPRTGEVKRVAGERWHRRHGKSVRRVRILKRLAGVCLLFALILSIVATAFWFSK